MRDAAPSPSARGIAAAQIVLILGAIASLAAGFVFVRPAITAAAGSEAPVLETPNDARLAEACGSLRELLRRSRETLGVYGASADGVREILFWGEDANLDGAMQAGELILLTYSRSMGVLAAYAGAAEDAFEGDPSLDIVGEPAGRSFDPDRTVRGGEVGERLARALRTTPGIRRTVLAVGLEDVRIERVREPGGATSHRLRVIWPGEGLDTPEEACACAL